MTRSAHLPFILLKTTRAAPPMMGNSPLALIGGVVIVFCTHPGISLLKSQRSNAKGAAKEETLCRPSPYLTEYLNRFGVHDWNSKRPAPSLGYELKILPG